MHPNISRMRPEEKANLRTPELLSGAAMLGGVELRIAGRTRAPEDDLRRGPLHQRFAQRQRGAAKGAFRRHPADVPVRPATARAVIDFAIAIDGVVPAIIRIESLTGRVDRAEHVFTHVKFVRVQQPTMGRSVSSPVRFDSDQRRSGRHCVPSRDIFAMKPESHAADSTLLWILTIC